MLKLLLARATDINLTVFQMHIRIVELVNREETEDVSNDLQEELGVSTEQPKEDIVLQINPASTKNDKKQNEDVNGIFMHTCIHSKL